MIIRVETMTIEKHERFCFGYSEM